MRKIKHSLALFFVLILSVSLSGCIVQKHVYDGDTQNEIAKATVRPGTSKNIAFKIKVTPDPALITAAAAENADLNPTTGEPTGDTVYPADNEVEPNYYIIETLTSEIPDGFEVYLLSVDQDVLPTPKEVKTNDEIFRRDYTTGTPEFNISYKLRIVNRTNEAYEKEPTADGFLHLFNYSFPLKTTTDFIGRGNVPQPALSGSVAKINSLEVAPEDTPEPQTNPNSTITIETGTPGKITPVLEGVTLEKDGATAHWGYINENNFKVTLSSKDSSLTTGTAVDNPAPPRAFEPGTVKGAFNPKFTSQNLEWSVQLPEMDVVKSLATAPSLKQTLTDNKSEAKSGDIMDYVITLNNPSQSESFKDVLLTEAAPAGTSFEPNGQNSFTAGENGKYTAKLDTLSPGETKVLHFICKASNSSSASNLVNNLTVEYMVGTVKFDMTASDTTAYIVTIVPPPPSGAVLPATGGFVEANDILLSGILLFVLGALLVKYTKMQSYKLNQ